MADLPELSYWEPGIYQLEISDPVLGGPGNISNRQPTQLANRTVYLKEQIDTVAADIVDQNTRLGAAEATIQDLPTQITAVDGRVTTNESSITALQALIGTSGGSGGTGSGTVQGDLTALTARVDGIESDVSTKAPIDSPTFTGAPKIPESTDFGGDNNSIADSILVARRSHGTGIVDFGPLFSFDPGDVVLTPTPEVLANKRLVVVGANPDSAERNIVEIPTATKPCLWWVDTNEMPFAIYFRLEGETDVVAVQGGHYACISYDGSEIRSLVQAPSYRSNTNGGLLAPLDSPFLEGAPRRERRISFYGSEGDLVDLAGLRKSWFGREVIQLSTSTSQFISHTSDPSPHLVFETNVTDPTIVEIPVTIPSREDRRFRIENNTTNRTLKVMTPSQNSTVTVFPGMSRDVLVANGRVERCDVEPNILQRVFANQMVTSSLSFTPVPPNTYRIWVSAIGGGGGGAAGFRGTSSDSGSRGGTTEVIVGTLDATQGLINSTVIVSAQGGFGGFSNQGGSSGNRSGSTISDIDSQNSGLPDFGYNSHNPPFLFPTETMNGRAGGGGATSGLSFTDLANYGRGGRGGDGAFDRAARGEVGRVANQFGWNCGEGGVGAGAGGGGGGGLHYYSGAYVASRGGGGGGAGELILRVPFDVNPNQMLVFAHGAGGSGGSVGSGNQRRTGGRGANGCALIEWD